MNFSEKQQLLQSALQQLSGYRTLQCGQNHEKVVEISEIEAGNPEMGHEDHPGWKLNIKGLCSAELRNSTLGCSHNMVLSKYNRVINDLISQDLIGQTALPMKEMNDVIAEIYRMDHEKGRLEKYHAVLKKEQSDVQQEAETAQKLQELRQGHVELIKKLEILHQKVLQELRLLQEL